MSSIQDKENFMNKFKTMIGMAMILLMLFAQAGNVLAAPLQEGTPITGTVTKLACETDATTGENTFVVTLETADGTQTVSINQQAAIDLGLVTADAEGNVDCTSESVLQELQNPPDTEITIDSSAVIPDDEEEEDVHPISALLASFFDADPGEIDALHEDGFGFGLIAQALWISQNVTDDASLAGDILIAKQDKDFTAFFEAHPEYLAEGETAPTNWGQFKKLLSNKKDNLGSVVSGNTEPSEGNDNGHGNGNNNGNGNNGNGNGNGNNGNGNNGNGNGNGNGHGNGNGNNKP
jgi:hypothetical protein